MINFNAAPYFDDYDESKGFYKILFRPSVAVQARELNQMQTILQKQVERFGSHIFKEGSIVIGGAFDPELNIPYVKGLNISITPSSINIDAIRSKFVDKTVVGSSSGISGVVRAVEYDPDIDRYVFMVRYKKSSNVSNVFSANETVVVEDDVSSFFTVAPSEEIPTGNGSIFSILQGAIFFKGYFVAFPKQTVVINKYSSTPTCDIGMKFTQSIVTEIQDESLLDNALGTYNENAPGAHRYAFDAKLTVIEYNRGSEDPDFATLASYKEGLLEENKERSQYNILQDELAKRTYDESGDYYVRGLNVVTREHLDNGSNEGLYTVEKGGNNQLISIDIDPGVAYVKGYERKVLTTQHIITEKSTEYTTVNESATNFRTGNYILINEITGSPIFDTGAVVDLYNAVQTRITSGIIVTDTSFTGTIIGKARIKGMVYESGVLGSPTGTMRLYLYDVNMLNNANFASVASVVSSGNFVADVVGGYAIAYDQNKDDLFAYSGSDHIKTLKDQTGTSETSFVFYKTFDNQNFSFLGGATGTTSLSSSVSNETIASTGTLSTAEKRDLIVTLKSSRDITLPGTAAVTGTAVTGDAQSNFNKLNIGDRVRIATGIYYVASINPNGLSMTLTTPAPTPIPSGTTVYKVMLAGDVIDLTQKGTFGPSGTVRTATVIDGELIINLKEDLSLSANGGDISSRISVKMRRQAGAEIKKTLTKNVYVKINTTSFTSTTAPIPIGLPDVFKLRNVYKKNSGAITQGDLDSLTGPNPTITDVTSLFTLDNGQRDNLYDHARIIPKNGSVFTAGNHLLVKVDVFNSDFSTGFGYFSIDSYPINDLVTTGNTIQTVEIPVYKTSAGVEYNLKDSLDFRPYKANTAVLSTTVAGATTNPVYSVTGNLKVGENGLRIPAPDSTINLDYTYYLARRDVVAMDKDGNFTIIKGEAATSPVTPSIPDNVMGVAQVYIAPYPSVSEKLGRILNNKTNVCVSNLIANIRYTMREIGVLKNRIENLEYYTALTLLEKSAVDLKVIDPTTNLDRFKNGYFVDGFLDHSLGANYRSDYNIAVDRAEQSIKPVFDMDAFRYNFLEEQSDGVLKTGNLITRPYQEVLLIDQPSVTTTRNIELSIYRFVGTMELTPEGDIWVDTQTVDKTIEFGNEIPADKVMSTEVGSWQNVVTGYKLYDRAIGDRSGIPDPKKYIGTYTSYAAALAASKSDQDQRFLIETVTTQQQTNVSTIITSETQTEELGSFVTSASLIPYIRPQVVRILIQGVKANTRFYTFFDGEDMSAYVTPYTISNGDINTAEIQTQEGGIWRSDEFGNLLGLLRLPAEGKRFRTGTKEVFVTDNPTNSTATSYARGYFTAQGLSVQKQNTILSTQVPVVTQEETVNTRNVRVKTEIFGKSCMAYSFKVNVPESEEGIFLTSVDVFIESMHPTLGVDFEIREMDSAGGITRNQVPYSEVVMKRNDPRIQLNPYDANRDYSTNPLVPTKVNFPCPVFLYNDTQYAFVIHTEGLNPDTYFYVSKLSTRPEDVDLITKQPVTARRLTGNLYTTNNNLNYDIVPDEDLTVKFYRANFSTGSGTAYFGNRPTEFLTVDESQVTSPYTQFGRKIYGSNRLTFSSIATGGNSINIGDKIVNTSGVLGNVLDIQGIYYYVDAFDFVAGEEVTVRDSVNVPKNINAVIATSEGGVGTLRSYKESDNLIILDNSNGQFYVGAKLKEETGTQINGAVSAFSRFPYSISNLKPHFLKFNNTNITFEKSGFDPAASNMTPYVPGNADSSSEFDMEVCILSRYTELALRGGDPSSKMKSVMSTQSNFVSPVIDVSRCNSVYVHNLINNPVYSETPTPGLDLYTELQPSGGDLINKYISKTVTLADNQDAEDLLVKLTAYRPPGSTIRVWMKIRNAEDGETFDKKPWIEMGFDEAFSSKSNKNNFIEMNFYVKPENLIEISESDPTKIVYYTANGTTYKRFKQFAVKIGLMGTNSALVPRVGDLRAIALQK